MEEKFDKLISLIETQNKAWQKCLTILTEMNTLLFDKYKSDDLLLEEHPAVTRAAPVTVGNATQPHPFNDYSDSVPYGTELESEREAPYQSFPATQQDIPESPPEYGEEPTSASESAESNSADSATQEPKMRITPGPPVSSKAELLERVEKVP